MVRWFICILLFSATALCFLDRQVLSVLSKDICVEFEMSDSDYSKVTTGFLISYGVMFLLSGILIDKLGTRRGLGISVLVWTIASAVHAVIRTPFQMGGARFLLGMGEGGCFPGVAKAAAEWFPKKERALAVGIAIGGASIGGLVAPPMTQWLAGVYGWRGAFLATGVLGAIWCTLWFVFYFHPKQSRWIGQGERELILNDVSQTTCSDTQTVRPLKSFTLAVVGLSLARFVFDPVFYFYMFWIPKYLQESCGASPDIIRLTGIPFLVMGVTNIVGGLASDFFVRRGIPVMRARKSIMVVAALITLASSLVPFCSGSGYLAILLMSTLMFGHGFWITNYVALISDNFPKNRVATVMGISGAIGTLGGCCGNLAIGWVVERSSYLPVWIASGLMYPVALVIILLTVTISKVERKI